MTSNFEKRLREGSKRPTPAQMQGEAVRGLKSDVSMTIRKLKAIAVRSILLNEMDTARVLYAVVKKLEAI